MNLSDHSCLFRRCVTIQSADDLAIEFGEVDEENAAVQQRRCLEKIERGRLGSSQVHAV